MSYRGREYEVKLLIPLESNLDIQDINQVLLDIFPPTRSIYATSTDVYWTLPLGSEGQFIRARNLDGRDNWQITVKSVDGIDRMEREIETTDNPIAMLRAAHGIPVGKLTKTYYTHWLASGEWDNVSAYVVKEAPELGVVVELESTTTDRVLAMESELMLYFTGILQVTPTRAPGSLYTMLLGGK